ncbi:TRAP transporter large permease [Butyricicoccus faecihominis]|uniref:TRAP transporter large permease n=1 Tax=Butyricicoccus faecihominis TaxID=1712515 RepID=UPI002479FC1F|nr:TRAP transporter large permease [Butyricicoccus faecihominis]MCQ5130531.1 TRAP transporter large permease [Butyricicoccus faecihominis]
MLAPMLIGVLVLMLLAVPISISLGIASMIPFALNPGFAFDASMFLRNSLSGLNSTITIAIPLFVLSGIIMAKGKISEKLFNIFSYFIGNMPGGLPCAVVVTCLFYGAISGSAPATTAAVGAMTIPLLVSLGYELQFSAALVAVAGGLGVIIPPSIPFILYSSAVSGASVGSMFIAGIIPGLLIGAALMAVAVWYCKKHGEDTQKIQAHVRVLHDKGLVAVLLDSSWALLSPIIILGGIYGGFFTPTEAAAVSVIYSLIISLFVYRTLKLRDLMDVFAEAASTYAPILFIIATASAFGRVLTMTQAPQIIATTLGTAFPNKIALMIVINLFLLIVGMFMDTTPAILILAPILAPIVTAVGINPVHFGIIMVCNLAVGFITPPIGNNLYVASTLTKVPVMSLAKKVLPFMAAFLIVLVAIIFIPQISLVLVGA